jgi:GTP-binding protein
MLIRNVTFAGAIGQSGQAPPSGVDGLAQVAFSGRSNVGKSSLINRFLGRTRSPVARVSGTPGKTQEINFFRVESDGPDFALVDLPGYGYARAPAQLRERWRALIDEFLAGSRELRGVVQLVDIRHGLSLEDRKAITYLADLGIPVLYVLTKSDKLGIQRRGEAVREITRELEADESQVIPVSSLSGEGVEDLRDVLGSFLAEADTGENGETPGPEAHPQD